MAKSRHGKGNTIIVSSAISAATAIRFRDMSDRLGVAQSAIIRRLIEGAVEADKFVFTAIGDYEGGFEVDILLPEVEAGKMALHCAMKAQANKLKEQDNADNS